MGIKEAVTWEGDEVCMVTGGAGFIGSHLVRELARQGKKVVAYDFVPDASYIADCVDTDRTSAGKVTFVYGDVADMPHLVSVMAEHQVDVVIHLAYMLVPDTVERLGWAIRTNCVGFHNVLEAARVLGVRRVVWASSGSAYGLAKFYPPGPVNEDVFVNPVLVYGACKLFNEHIGRFYRDELHFDNIGFRKPVAYGLGKSRLRDYSIAHLLVENAVLGRPLEMPPVDYNMNWLYVKDIVRAYMLAAQAPPTEHLIFNVGGFVHSCSEVVEILKGLFPQLSVIQQEGYILSHPIEVSAYDQSRAKREFGYEPVYDLEDAVRDYVETVEQFGEQYKGAWSAYEVTPLP
jgi:nucleoside-diphosphate-sugar epimerase